MLVTVGIVAMLWTLLHAAELSTMENDMDAFQKVGLSILTFIFVGVVLFLLLYPAPARAETSCEEWASMTKVLVMRWQKDPAFVNVSLTAAQLKLAEMMDGHPELNTALTYVDFAYQNRDGDPVEIWVKAHSKCVGSI